MHRLEGRALGRTAEEFRLENELPTGLSALAILPYRDLFPGCTADDTLILAGRDVDWSEWRRFAREHEALDDARFERLEGLKDGTWVAYPDSHPPHVRWIRMRLPNAQLAGRGDDGRLHVLASRPIEDLAHHDLLALYDDGDTDADTLEQLERDHWSSKLGGAPSFSQGTLRALSRSRGTVLPFLGQLRGDVAHDPYGYTFYVFGDAAGNFAITHQR